MDPAFRKICNGAFGASGRRVIDKKRKKTGPCQSIEGKAMETEALGVEEMKKTIPRKMRIENVHIKSYN